jgi:hypothetical protein
MYIINYTQPVYNIIGLPSCKLTQTLPKWGGLEYEFWLKIGDAHRLSGSMLIGKRANSGVRTWLGNPN